MLTFHIWDLYYSRAVTNYYYIIDKPDDYFLATIK